MRRRRIQSLISALLLILSAALLALAAFLYFQPDKDPAEPARATAVPGHYQLIDVVDIIEAQGLKVEFGGPTTGVRSRMLDSPGQLLTVGDGQVYVFIYPDVDSQENASLDVDARDVDLISVSGDSLDTPNATLSAKSNVAVFIVGLNDEATTKIDKAIQSLP